MAKEKSSNNKKAENPVRLRIEPKGDNSQPKVKKGWIRLVGEFFGVLKKYTEKDLQRLKEAGISQVESKVEIQKADAALKNAQTSSINLNAEADFLVKKAQAMNILSQALERINKNGGNISYDAEQINRILNEWKGLEEDENK